MAVKYFFSYLQYLEIMFLREATKNATLWAVSIKAINPTLPPLKAEFLEWI